METVKYIAFVRCRGDSVEGLACDIVGLNYEQYLYQLNRPNAGWECPNCGSSANYLDRESEAAQDKYYTDLQEPE